MYLQQSNKSALENLLGVQKNLQPENYITLNCSDWNLASYQIIFSSLRTNTFLLITLRLSMYVHFVGTNYKYNNTK